ncbi:MAG: hypothetical protein IT366_18930 [Candidatus Hydrogenedentes bacterium]|nr:hypothetical protein [Candidatus Hydrogenedentota bacterium]
MKVLNCEPEIQPWVMMFEGYSVFPEYLTDANVLVCPSSPSGSSALELFDEGITNSEHFEDIPGFSNNGIVEPCEFTEHPYVYMAWAISPGVFVAEQAAVGDLEAFELEAEALGEGIELGDIDLADLDWELSVTIGGRNNFPRIREGIERFFVTDINNPAGSAQSQSSIPVMWDEIADEATHFNHVPGGSNVLYMDGHVEFQKYQGLTGTYPTNEAGLILHEMTHGGHGH